MPVGHAASCSSFQMRFGVPEYWYCYISVSSLMRADAFFNIQLMPLCNYMRISPFIFKKASF